MDSPFPKRPALRILVAVLALQTSCAMGLRLFTWRVSSADESFAADLRQSFAAGLSQFHSNSDDPARKQAPQAALLLASGLRVHEGERAPSFCLRDADGKNTRLNELLGQRPVVIEFGSFT
ncbi:MAG TPA: hypothetical protein VGY58_24370 [Gemmataceae bacterium]|jgi:hypothetical protein|nr:hypothetical protein [Gemmataceae bacterium]